MKDNKDRITIIELYKIGMKNPDIVKVTGYRKMMVKRAVDREYEFGSSS